MQDIHQPPRHIAEHVRIASKEGSAHALHHEYAGEDDRQTRENDDQMIHLILQRIFCKFARRGRGFSGSAQPSALRVFYIHPIRPDGPEIHPERGVDDMKQNGGRENEARDPMISHPGKFMPQLGQEGGNQQRQHRRRHHPMKQPGCQRMPGNLFRNRRRQWQAPPLPRAPAAEPCTGPKSRERSGKPGRAIADTQIK